MPDDQGIRALLAKVPYIRDALDVLGHGVEEATFSIGRPGERIPWLDNYITTLGVGPALNTLIEADIPALKFGDYVDPERNQWEALRDMFASVDTPLGELGTGALGFAALAPDLFSPAGKAKAGTGATKKGVERLLKELRRVQGDLGGDALTNAARRQKGQDVVEGVRKLNVRQPDMPSHAAPRASVSGGNRTALRDRTRKMTAQEKIALDIRLDPSDYDQLGSREFYDYVGVETPSTDFLSEIGMERQFEQALRHGADPDTLLVEAAITSRRQQREIMDQLRGTMDDTPDRELLSGEWGQGLNRDPYVDVPGMEDFVLGREKPNVFHSPLADAAERTDLTPDWHMGGDSAGNAGRAAHGYDPKYRGIIGESSGTPLPTGPAPHLPTRSDPSPYLGLLDGELPAEFVRPHSQLWQKGRPSPYLPRGYGYKMSDKGAEQAHKFRSEKVLAKRDKKAYELYKQDEPRIPPWERQDSPIWPKPGTKAEITRFREAPNTTKPHAPGHPPQYEHYTHAPGQKKLEYGSSVNPDALDTYKPGKPEYPPRVQMPYRDPALSEQAQQRAMEAFQGLQSGKLSKEQVWDAIQQIGRKDREMADDITWHLQELTGAREATGPETVETMLKALGLID